MKITWLGTAGIVLEEKETRIAFDPFGGIYYGDLKNPPEKFGIEAYLRNLSAVFVTHGHFDHIFHFPRLFSNTETPIFCTEAPAQTLKKHGIKEKVIHKAAPGQSEICGEFEIKMFQGKHCKFDKPLLRRTVFSKRFISHPGHLFRLLKLFFTYPENGEILFYEVCAFGKRIQIMGSMNLDDATEYPQGADILILPLQGRSDQDTYALSIVERLKPKEILLDHFDNTFPPLTQEVSVQGFIKNVDERFSVPCRALEKFNSMILNTEGEIQCQKQ